MVNLMYAGPASEKYTRYQINLHTHLGPHKMADPIHTNIPVHLFKKRTQVKINPNIWYLLRNAPSSQSHKCTYQTYGKVSSNHFFEGGCGTWRHIGHSGRQRDRSKATRRSARTVGLPAKSLGRQISGPSWRSRTPRNP